MTQLATSVPSPVPDPGSAPFWAAAREGRFILRRCRSCGRAHWYPRAICPFCWSADTEWCDASGRGTVYAFSVMRRVPQPYAVAYVTLEEGPTMLTNVVECDFDALAIGQPVVVTFKPSDSGPPVPMFKPG